MAKLISNLTKIAAAMPGAASEALLQTGSDVFSISQDLVPVDTSALKNSGGVVPESSSKVVIGYGNEEVDYAEYVEYGTERSPAQPYLTPAFAQSEETFQKRFSEAVKKKATEP